MHRSPAGLKAQLNALGRFNSTKHLAAVPCPSLVVHGRDDLLVPLPCGVDTARHIPNARLEIIDGMGHNLPEGLMPALTELIAGHAEESMRIDPAAEVVEPRSAAL